MESQGVLTISSRKPSREEACGVLCVVFSTCCLLGHRNPSVLDDCKFREDNDEKNALLFNIKHRLTPNPVKIRAGFNYHHYFLFGDMSSCLYNTDIDVSCYGYEGIDAVKTALRAGLKQSTEDMPIKVHSLQTAVCGGLN